MADTIDVFASNREQLGRIYNPEKTTTGMSWYMEPIYSLL